MLHMKEKLIIHDIKLHKWTDEKIRKMSAENGIMQGIESIAVKKAILPRVFASILIGGSN
jgi:hypothetical protein